MAAVLALGIMIFGNRETFFRVPGLRREMENETYTSVPREVYGKVCTAEKKGGNTVYLLETGKKYGRVNVYVPDSVTGKEEIRIGCHVMFEGNFFLYEDAGNPGQFDVRAYYDCREIYLAFNAETASVHGKHYDRLKNFCYEVRLYLVKEIERFSLPEDRDFFTALLTGSASDDEETKRLFGIFGISYVLSVSGLKITLIGSALYGLFRKKLSVNLSALLSASAVTFYVMMTGEHTGAVRSLLLFMIRVSAPIVKRKFDLLSAAALAFILMLLDCPLLIRTSAVWYYFAVLIASGWLYPAVMRCVSNNKGIVPGVIYSLLTGVCLLPVRLYFEYGCSLYGLIVSALTLPVMGILFVSVFSGTVLSGLSPAAGAFLFGTGHYLRKYLLSLTGFFSGLPGDFIVRGRPSMIRLLVYGMAVCAAGICFGCFFRKNRERPENEEKKIGTRGCMLISGLLFCFWISGIFFLKAPEVGKDEMKIVMIDVGQGDGFLLRTADVSVLIDCGSSSEKDPAGDILLPLLNYYGIDRLDAVFLSHADTDHTGAVEAVIENSLMPVERLYFPDTEASHEAFRELTGKAWHTGTRILALKTSDRLSFPAGEETLTLECLWPEAGSISEDNDASMVLKAEYAGNTALFTGDISSAVEQEITDPGKIRILKTAHHGSKYSTSDSFLDRIRPEIALVSAGKNNLYGHPAPETVKRLEEHGTSVYQSASAGAVTLTIERSGRILAETFRKRTGEGREN